MLISPYCLPSIGDPNPSMFVSTATSASAWQPRLGQSPLHDGSSTGLDKYTDLGGGVVTFGRHFGADESRNTPVNTSLALDTEPYTWEAPNPAGPFGVISKGNPFEFISNALIKDLADTAERDFETLFSARGQRFSSLFTELPERSSPYFIIRAAISKFRRFGNEDRLSLAANLLLEFPPAESIEAICRVYNEGIHEASAFVGTLEILDAPEKIRSWIETTSHTGVE